MRQDRDEPVRAFGASLRGRLASASLHRSAQVARPIFTTLRKDVLCRGLDDSEIQIDLLGDKNQDMTKEAGKRSVSRLLLPQVTDAVARSSYRRQKKVSFKGQETCMYCRTKGHGRNPPTRIRIKECPAFGNKCSHCNKDHHFEEMCRRKQRTKGLEHDDLVP